MISRKRIILVDDDLTNLIIGKEILGRHFDVLTVSSGSKMLQVLDNFMPHLILLDIDMPQMDGFETLRRLKEIPKAADIPVIFVSARDDVASHERGFDLGAVDFIHKPYVPLLLTNLVNQHLLLAAQHAMLNHYEAEVTQATLKQCDSLLQIQDSLFDTLRFLSAGNWGNLMNPQQTRSLRSYLSEMTSEMHLHRIYSQELALWNDESFAISAQLHDIGKIIVRDEILQKPGRLTPEEFEAVKHHTTFGVRVIEHMERDAGQTTFFKNAKLFAAAHHERWDGTGYPLGLSGTAIPLQGRLLAIVDVYNALVSERPYKKPLPPEAARAIIRQNKGTQFDPLLTDLFLDVSDKLAQRRIDPNA